jgi:Protein of unknown function (DUF3631)
VLKYFESRGLDLIAVGADSQLRTLENWRGNETAVLAAITGAAGELVALQVLCVTPDGEKSAVLPVRKTIRGPHDWRRRGAFRLGSAGSVHLVQVEGVEDAIAARMAGAERVHACLGVNGIGRDELPLAVTRVTVARDDDPSGSPASLSLGRGVARIMLQGRSVSITPRAGSLSLGAKDLNDLLKVDPALAKRQLEEARSAREGLDPAEREAFLEEVSQAPSGSYETARTTIASALGWRAAVLDEDRNRRRRDRAKQASPDAAVGVDIIDPEPSPDPVTDIAAVLDNAVKEIRRFLIVTDPTHLYVIALWSLQTHLLHLEKLRVSTTSRLAFQSPSIRCGKSTGLKCVLLMSHKGRMAGSITPPALFRAIEDDQVSIMVDEADHVFRRGNDDLAGIFNSGIDRMTAYVMRAVPVGERDHKARYFRTFTGIACTSVKQLPIEAVQDRVIALPMQRAKKDERPERLTMETRGGLIDIGRKFARWASDLTELPKLDRSTDLYNRIEDKWFTLFQIAQLAGGEWPERCNKAALVSLAREEANGADGGMEGDLLADVWRVFHESGKEQMFTKDICTALNALDESPWATVRHGQPIDGNYLRKHLDDFLPDNAEKIAPRKWRDATTGEQARGYHELHFKDAFERYLNKGSPSDKSKPRNLPPPSPSESTSHPSHPPQSDKSQVSSITETGAGTNSSPVTDPSQAPQGVGSLPKWDGSGTAATNPFVPKNEDQNQDVGGDGTGGTDRTGVLTGPPGGDAPPATEGYRTTDNRNSDERPFTKPNGSGAAQTPLPRGAQGRGFGKLGKGAPP